MSLSYLFLGIPKTFDELVDYAKRRKVKKVGISASAYDRDCKRSCSFKDIMENVHFNYSFYVDLMADGASLRVAKYDHSMSVDTMHSAHMLADKLYLYRRVLSDAVMVAEKLERSDILSSINGDSIDSARELMRSAEENIRKFGSSLVASKAIRKDIMKI